MYIYGRNPVLEALENKQKISTLYITGDSTEGSIRKIYKISREKKIIIKNVDKKKLDALSDGKNHQGVVAQVEEYDYYDFNDLLRDIEKKTQAGIKNHILVLDNVEDPHNFGSIIRSALGASFDAIVIQNRRSVQVTPAVIKSSSGTAQRMKISRVTNISTAIDSLKKVGLWVYALDMSGESIYRTNLTGDIVLVVGNEGRGISQRIKKESDFTIKIPMSQKIESLNVSVAAAISMFEVARQKGS